MISDDKLEQVCQAIRDNAPTGTRTTILDVFEEEDQIDLPELTPKERGYIEKRGNRMREGKIMSNFTVAIPDELLTDAKVMAAKAGTSLNAIIRTLLEGFVQNENSPMTGNFEILLQYSLGQLSAKSAVKKLHLDDESALNMMTRSASLPLPRLSLEENEAMRKRFGEMLSKAKAG